MSGRSDERVSVDGEAMSILKRSQVEQHGECLVPVMKSGGRSVRVPSSAGASPCDGLV